MKILFWIEKRRLNSRGEASIILRITHHGKRVNTSTGVKVKPESWDAKKQRVKGSNDLANSINELLSAQRSKCLNVLGKLIQEGKAFSSSDVAMLIKGKEKPEIGWLKLFDRHIRHLEARIGSDYSASTVRRYKSSRKNLALFINDCLKKSDLNISEVSRTMIAELDQYLRGEFKFSNNYVIKTMQQIRKVFKLGKVEGYVSHNPFDLLSYKKTDTHKDFLYADELKRLQAFETYNEKLAVTRDIFIFMCYTGLAHSDVKKAAIQHLKLDHENRPWLTLRRTKTDNLVQVPLLAVAVEILKNYEGHPKRLSKGLLLPVPCNQVLNRNLKDLANAIGLNKHLCSHSGRYTFGSTVLLSNGVRVEVAQKLLAHSSIKSTMIYSKLSSESLIGDLNLLEDRLK